MILGKYMIYIDPETIRSKYPRQVIEVAAFFPYDSEYSVSITKGDDNSYSTDLCLHFNQGDKELYHEIFGELTCSIDKLRTAMEYYYEYGLREVNTEYVYKKEKENEEEIEK